jgi:RimJ/RimL family protein N-acetyltransferase
MNAGSHTSDFFQDYPKEVLLKDGTGVTLRPLVEGDEDHLSHMYHRLSENDRWFLACDTPESMFFVKRGESKEKGKTASIVAVLEERIVAHATLMTQDYGAKSHIGEIRIAVDPHFRGMRLATWMLFDLINLAMAMALEILVMWMIPEREASVIRSVEKLDFIQETVLRDFVKDREGNPHDLVIMVKRLQPWWNAADCKLP